ncbi:MAG: cytochrome-c peroxidase [Crocinitomicaceae bacterium]|nr:cytochrome-c peroxidase [Crocinitomicaceae bacterium]
MKVTALVIFIGLFLLSCRKDKHYPVTMHEQWGEYNPQPYNFPVAFENFPAVPEPDWNKTTVEGAYLGRKLYYDTILSMNGRSCSTCHHQEEGFTSGIPGPNGMSIPPHVNLAWNSNYGWLGDTHALDSVALADLAEGNIFLNANNDSILSRLSRHDEYPKLFWQAFGIEIIKLTTDERKKYISYALAQFMRTQISYNSKFDKYLRGEVSLTSDEIAGFSLFMDENGGDCFHCHGSSSNPMWRDNLMHNNGLNSTFSGNDLGLFNITGNTSDIGKFRTPTLRNIELTAPYMHDGRYATLEEVVEFYSTGLQHSVYIDPLMKKVDDGGVLLNPVEKTQMVAFLKTLTDDTFTSNPELSKPE